MGRKYQNGLLVYPLTDEGFRIVQFKKESGELRVWDGSKVAIYQLCPEGGFCGATLGIDGHRFEFCASDTLHGGDYLPKDTQIYLFAVYVVTGNEEDGYNNVLVGYRYTDDPEHEAKVAERCKLLQVDNMFVVKVDESEV